MIIVLLILKVKYYFKIVNSVWKKILIKEFLILLFDGWFYCYVKLFKNFYVIGFNWFLDFNSFLYMYYIFYNWY